MSDTPKIITPDNMQTVIAVCFILGLLALAFNFFNYNQIHQVTTGVGNLQVDNRAAQSAIPSAAEMQALNDKLAELEGKVAALDEWKAAEDAEDAAEGEE